MNSTTVENIFIYFLWRDHRLKATRQDCVEPENQGQALAVRRKWGLCDAELFKKSLPIQAFW